MAGNPLIRKRPRMTGRGTGGHKSAGILDDFAVRKNVATKEGTIEKVPVNGNDIVNKDYADSLASAAAGLNTEIQFNDSGSFGASSDLTWDGSALLIGGNCNPLTDNVGNCGSDGKRWRNIYGNDYYITDKICKIGEDTCLDFNIGGFLLKSAGNSNLTFSATLNRFNPSALDMDTTIRGDADINLLHCDAGTDRVGIGNAAPSEKLDVTGNIAVSGTVDGIDIATDVAANTLKDTNVTTNLSLGATNATTMIVASSDGTDATLIEADTDNAGLLGADKWDEVVASTAHITADGSSHTFINQNVTTTGTPEFGITTLADTSVMKTTAAPLADAQIANKKYVDDQVAGGGSATKEFWVPCFDAEIGIDADGLALANLSSTGETWFNYCLPADFNSYTALYVVMYPDTTETINFDFDFGWGSNGEGPSTSGASGQTQAVTADQIYELDITPSALGHVAGDYVSLNFASNTSNIRVMGVKVKYT